MGAIWEKLKISADYEARYRLIEVFSEFYYYYLPSWTFLCFSRITTPIIDTPRGEFQWFLANTEWRSLKILSEALCLFLAMELSSVCRKESSGFFCNWYLSSVSHGGTEVGQGINTKVAQAVARVLGVDVSLIRIACHSTITTANRLRVFFDSVSRQIITFVHCNLFLIYLP